MPVLFNDLLDDPLVFDQCLSFVGGQFSNSRANLIAENQAALLVNCDITKTGELVTRRGTSRLGAGTAGTGTYIQGNAFFETPNYNYPVVVNGGKLYYFDGSDWLAFAVGWTANDSSGRVIFTQGINKLYFTDRVGHLFSWDGASLVDLGGSGNAYPPPAPSFITWHTDRLVVAGGPTDPDALYFSQFLDGATYDRTKWQLRVGAGEGDAVTGMCPWLDFNLIVFKRHSVWVVNCDPQLQINDTNDTIAGFTIKPIHRRIGCIAPNSAAQVGSDVFFLSDSGVRSVKRTESAEHQSEVSEALSAPVQDIIDRINLNASATIVGTFFNNRYFLSLPLDGSSTPNYVLVYNALTQSWSGLWTGWTPTSFSVRNVTGNVPRLNFGDASGYVSEWLDYVQATAETDDTYKDAGTDIPVTIKTRSLIFGEPFNKKTGFNCEFEFNRSSADVMVEVVRDDGDPETFQAFQTLTAAVTLPVTLPFTLARNGIFRPAFDLQAYAPFREIQFVVTTTSKKMVLRSLTATGFVDTMDIQNSGTAVLPATLNPAYTTFEMILDLTTVTGLTGGGNTNLDGIDPVASSIAVGRTVAITIDDSIQFRKLEAGTPEGEDIAVYNDATLRWRITGGT